MIPQTYDQMTDDELQGRLQVYRRRTREAWQQWQIELTELERLESEEKRRAAR